MAASIVLSGVVALTLTPVLCAMLLKNTHGQARRRTPIGIFLDWFDRTFERWTGRYVGLLRRIVDRRAVTAGLFLAFDGRDPDTGLEVAPWHRARRINSVMMLCGHYDNSGEFAYRVGLPGKSGVGGGILAVAPGHGQGPGGRRGPQAGGCADARQAQAVARCRAVGCRGRGHDLA